MRIKFPKHGEQRIKSKYLIFPQDFDNVWIWLERVFVVQRYVQGDGWKNIRLATQEEIERFNNSK